MQQYWTSFAKTGVPTSTNAKVLWSPYAAHNGSNVLVLGAEIGLVQHHKKQDCALMLSSQLGCGAPPPPPFAPTLYPGETPWATEEEAAIDLSDNGYSATLVHFDVNPVVSYVSGSSAFAQVFNPSWVVASQGTKGKAGLLIRTQNCSSKVGYCTKCNFAPCQDLSKVGMPGDWKHHHCQDVITFSELLNDDNQVRTLHACAATNCGLETGRGDCAPSRRPRTESK